MLQLLRLVQPEKSKWSTQYHSDYICNDMRLLGHRNCEGVVPRLHIWTIECTRKHGCHQQKGSVYLLNVIMSLLCFSMSLRCLDAPRLHQSCWPLPNSSAVACTNCVSPRLHRTSVTQFDARPNTNGVDSPPCELDQACRKCFHRSHVPCWQQQWHLRCISRFPILGLSM